MAYSPGYFYGREVCERVTIPLVLKLVVALNNLPLLTFTLNNLKVENSLKKRATSKLSQRHSLDANLAVSCSFCI